MLASLGRHCAVIRKTTVQSTVTGRGVVPAVSTTKVSSRHLCFTCFTLLLLMLMAAPIQALVQFAIDLENKQASQIIIIPFISAALVYRNRSKIFRDVRYSGLGGIGL